MASRMDYATSAQGGRDLMRIRAIAVGDRRAFEEMYAEYFGRLGRFLGRLTRSPEVIEETINDTFMVVWQKAGDFRGGSQVSTWVIGIAYRCALKALRRNGPRPFGPMPESSEPGYEPAAAQEREDWLASAFGHLSFEHRMTLELAYYLGHSCEEIAAVMECSVGTVKARMFHARVKLRNLLPELAGAPKVEYR
jgi:RNA polymerase sigma-70 factor (ECF subfamily)